MKQTYKELIKYGIIGFIGLGLDWGFFFIFRDVIGIPYIISHIISSAIAIFNNFILNSRFTFKTTDKIVRRGFSFFGIAAIGLIVSSTLLPLLVDFYNRYLEIYIHVENQKIIQNLAKLAVTIFVAALQFVANKYHTFKKPKSAT